MSVCDFDRNPHHLNLHRFARVVLRAGTRHALDTTRKTWSATTWTNALPSDDWRPATPSSFVNSPSLAFWKHYISYECVCVFAVYIGTHTYSNSHLDARHYGRFWSSFWWWLCSIRYFVNIYVIFINITQQIWFIYFSIYLVCSFWSFVYDKVNLLNTNIGVNMSSHIL